MRFILKLVLFLCLVVVGFYATIPLWLPYVIERQMPPGWQLESMETGYPGLYGIDIHTLRLRGAVTAADLGIKATDLRITYRSKTVEIDSVSLSVYLQAGEEDPGDSLAVNTLIFDLASFQLTPGEDGSFHISTDAALEGFPETAGHIEADASNDLFKADIRFPAELNSASWLTLQFEQKEQAVNTVSEIRAFIDTEPADQDWINWLLARSTNGLVTEAMGRLEIHAVVDGHELQDVQHLTLRTQELEVLTTSGPLAIKAALEANREGKDIAVTLSSPAEIQFEDEAGVIDQLLTATYPRIQRAPRTDLVAFLKLGSSGRFLIKPETRPNLSFRGPINLDLTASGERLHVESDNLAARMKELGDWASLTAVGLIKFDWQEDAGLGFLSEDLELKTEKLSATGEISSHDGKYISKGSGTLTAVEITEPFITAETVELGWQDLDLQKLTGKLSTRTHGLSATIDDKTWAGLDLDAEYRLIDGIDIKGRATLMFDDGPNLPIMFSGNTETNQWDITLRRTSINMQELTNMLGVAQVEIPDPLRLTDGQIEFGGKISIDEHITARTDITGADIDASWLKSHADDAKFSISATFDDTVSVIGPVSVESVGLAGGVELTDIKADVQIIDTDTYRLNKLSAGLFGGQLRLNRLQYTDDGLEDATLELNGIDFSRLLEYADFDGLKGSGLLDISLPASSDQTGISIRNGLFRSTVPGVLAYTKEGVAGSNIGMQALENFQYKDLSGEIDYQSDGSYQVKVRLEGNNPDLYEGHPVVFNLNIDGSLPKLFEALFLTGDFEEAILEEIR